MLRQIGMSINSVSKALEGETAIHRFQIGSAKLQFGTLVALLNDYERYSQRTEKDLDPVFLSKKRVTKDEVEITKYDWDDVALAVDILVFHGELEDKSIVDDAGLADREIWLTNKGLLSFYTEVYQQKHEDMERAKALDLSAIEASQASIITGKATVRLFWATVIIALATIATTLLPYLNDTEKNELREKVQEQQHTIEKLQHRLLPNGSPNSVP